MALHLMVYAQRVMDLFVQAHIVIIVTAEIQIIHT